MTAASARSPAKILADRLNLVPIALFSVWAGSMLIFWGQAFGPLLPFAAPPFAWAPLPWLALSLAAAMATRWLPAGWYRLRPFELSGRFYRLIGARMFRRLVSNGDYVNRIVARRHPNYRVHPARQVVAAAMKVSLDSERAHLFAFAAGISPMIYAWIADRPGWAGWLAGTNIACNLYPVFVQRLTRGRLLRIEKRSLRT